MSADDDGFGPGASVAPMPAEGPGHSDVTEPKVRTGPADTQTEITIEMPAIGPAGPQPQPTGSMGAPQSTGQAAARHEESRAAPPPRLVRAPAPTPAATTGKHRDIDALSHLGVRPAGKSPPQGGWRRLLYVLTRINLGLSPDERYEMELLTRIRRNAADRYQIGVVGLKGGVGRTVVTVALGSALSNVRGDRILAVDADPDAGNLADRAGRQSAATVANLLADEELARYNDIRQYTSMNGSNLEVLSSAEYSGARREFNDEDWRRTADIVSRYYNLVLADCGAGLFQPAGRGVLSTVSGLVIVASASIDGARQAAVTVDWLRQNGYQDLLGRCCVAINHVSPGKPNVDVADLVQRFERHVPPGRVLVLPWDGHIAAGADIELDLLGKTFRRRILELAAALSDDFDGLERRWALQPPQH